MKNTFDMFLEYISVNYHIMITMYYLYVYIYMYIYIIIFYDIIKESIRIRR